MAPLHILVIDDSPEDRLVLRTALEGANFTVSEAANGAEGLKAYHQSSPDCIILDYELPDMEGLIVLEKLIPDPTAPLASVVMLTGTGDDAIATLALKKGAQDYLNKSRLLPDDLRRVVHNALDRCELLAQRKRAEAARAASEARYRSIVEDQTEMVSRFHADGTLTFVNASYSRAFGRAPAELEGTSLYDLIPKVEQAFVRNAIAGLTSRNSVVTHRHPAFAADGTIRWQEWTNRLLPGSEGAPHEYQGTGRDITERKHAEDALRESQERITAILTMAMDAIVAVDDEQRIILFNPAAARLFRCPREEAVGKPLDRFIPERFRSAHAEHLRHFGETGGSTRTMGNLGALSGLRADGTEFPIEASISTAKVGGRTIFTVILRDISARRQAEDALCDSEARFRGTFENAAVGMAHVALDGAWLAVNDRLCAITGYSRDELLARTFQDITHPEDLAPDLDYVRELVAGKITNYSLDKRYIHKDGRVVWIALTVALQRSASGVPQYFISVVRDITKRKQVEGAIRASEERLAQAVAVAQIGIWETSHDTNEITASPTLQEMLGFRADEPIMFEEAFNRVLPEDRASLAEHIAHERDPAGDGVTAGETRIVHPTRGIRWLSMRAQAFFEGEGRARHWVRSIGAVQDITERKEAEEQLAQTTSRLRLALQAGRMGVWSWNLLTDAAVLDAAEYELLGYDHASPHAPKTGKEFFELVHPDDRERLVQNFEQTARSRESFYDEFRIVRADGALRWLATQGDVISDHKNIAVRLTGVNFDITARKGIEEALCASEERFRTMITMAQEGIWAVDRDAKTLFANSRMAELLRARVEELVGTPVSAFCFPEDTAEARARIAANLTGQRMDFEFRFRRTDGTPLYVLAATAPLYGPGGEIAGALGGFLNIAERKAAEEHQRFLMRELSHRSKNLLAVIQAIARQTGRSAELLEDFKAHFTQRLQGLAASHDVLIDQNWVGAPLVALLHQHLDPFIELEASRLQLDGPTVSVSPEAAQTLGLAFHELATNSVKYGALSRPDGKLTVTWAFEGNGIDGERLRVDWQERGGPSVAPPTRKGFGHAVIDRMVTHSLNGTVMLDFAPEGLSWSLSFPVTHLVNRAGELRFVHGF